MVGCDETLQGSGMNVVFNNADVDTSIQLSNNDDGATVILDSMKNTLVSETVVSDTVIPDTINTDIVASAVLNTDNETSVDEINSSTDNIVKTFLDSLAEHNDPDHIDFFNDTENSYHFDKTGSDTNRTKLFVNHQTLQRELYHYNQFHGILTSRNCFIFPCALSDGTIGVCIWRTKENRPKHHLVTYHPNTKQIVLVTNTSWMKNVNCLPLTQFNQNEVMR